MIKQNRRLSVCPNHSTTYTPKPKGRLKVDKISFNNVLLEKEQEELVCKIVEAARNVPRENRREFIVLRSSAGDYLNHPGLPDSESKIYASDLQTLSGYGLIQVTATNRYGILRFDIHPSGYLYYKYLKGRSGEPIEHMEEAVRSYINSHEFQKEYPKAYEKWTEAEKLLWETDTSKQLTTIGHLCREAIQEFMDTLYGQIKPKGEKIPKNLTKKRLEKIIEARTKQVGESERKFLNLLINLWEVVNVLVQKQEHGAQKEKVQLVWKDARRVVFQTMMMMFEVSQSLKFQS